MQHLLSTLVSIALTSAAVDAQEPAPARGVRLHEEGAFEGYTLYSPLRSYETYLVDMDGRVAHKWKSDYAPGNSVYLLPGGHLLRCGREDQNPRFHGGGIGGHVEEFDWDGRRLWHFTLSNEAQMIHHDVEPLPNGNVLVIAWEYVPRVDAIALGRDSGQVSDEGFWPDAILEIEPQRPEGGKVVWEWHAYDHLVQDEDASKPFYGAVPDEPQRIDVNADHRDEPPKTAAQLAEEREMLDEMRALGYVGGDEPQDDSRPRRPRADWLHTNSVDYNAEHDLIALSVPRLNEVWILDHSTTSEEAATDAGGRFERGGGILFRWGNPRVYGAGSRSDQQLFSQHDAQWIPAGHPGAGNLLVFNNGSGRADEGYSSVDELELPFDPERGFERSPGAAFAPQSPVWSYARPGEFFAFFISGAQRLANGNTLVCDGPQGRVFEVNREGELVWDYWTPHGGDAPSSFGRAAGGRGPNLSSHALFRATRIAGDDPRLSGRLP